MAVRLDRVLFDRFGGKPPTACISLKRKPRRLGALPILHACYEYRHRALLLGPEPG